MAHRAVVISKRNVRLAACPVFDEKNFSLSSLENVPPPFFLVSVAGFNISLESLNVTSPFFLDSWKILMFWLNRNEERCEGKCLPSRSFQKSAIEL